LILWTFGVETLIEREDPFRGFSGLVTVFERDGDIYRTRRATVGKAFNDQSFLAEKPAGGLRIFCLGGSSSWGFPWGAEVAFTSIVEELLTASHPERHVEAVNASGMSYAMHRLNIVADELLEYEPDVFLIYGGHNEFIEPAFFGALKQRSRIHTRVQYVLAHSRTYSGIASVFERIGDKKPTTRDDYEARVRRNENRVFSQEETEEIVAEYRGRLERLVRRAQDAGVRVVLTTVPCNLRQWRPKASATIAALEDKDRETWSEAFRSGRRRLAAEDLEVARADLERAARLAPGHAETQYMLGKTYDALGLWEGARRAYRNACDADASPIRRVSGINEAIREIAHKRGVLLVDVDRIFEARSPHGLVGFNLIEDYVHPTREGHELIARHIWDAIEREGWLGRKASADQAVFDRVIAERRRRPTTSNTVNAVWCLNQGIVLKNRGETEAAIEKYREALEIAPDYVGAMIDLGDLLLRTGQTTEAFPLIERSFEIDPENFGVRVNLSRVLQNLGRFDEAVTHIKEAVRMRPDDALAHNTWGNALAGLGRFEEAAPHYQEALRIRPDYAEAHNNWGNSLLDLGRLQESIAHYKEALRIKPDVAEPHQNLGSALARLGRFEEAAPHYQEALRIKPGLAEAHNNLGNLLMKMERFEEAAVHYREVSRIKPDQPDAHNDLGVALAKLGRLQDAVRHFEHAVRLKPDFTKGRNNLRRAQALLQQKHRPRRP